MPDIADFIPGGIKPTDRWHIKTNDDTCSRCGASVENDVPVMLFSGDGENMLIYCSACTTRTQAANDNRSIVRPIAHGMGRVPAAEAVGKSRARSPNKGR